MKIKLGVIFGGQTVEHEVSIISAVQAMKAMDKDKYEIIPIYVTKDLEWYTEIQTGGATVAGDLASPSSTKLVLNGKTGISYYF